MRVSLGLVLAAALGFVLATATPAADPGTRQRPTVTVRPAQAEFLAGEPIGIEITIANPGPLPAEFWLGDPRTFHGELSPIHFDGGRAASPRPSRAAIFTGPDLSVTSTVPAGTRWPGL